MSAKDRLVGVDLDGKGQGTGLDVAADTVRGLHAAEIGILSRSAGVDVRANTLAADAHAGNLQTELGRDKSRGVEAGPLVVGLVSKVGLDPGTGELAKRRQVNGATAAGAANLGVALDGNVGLATNGEVEVNGLVVLKEAVDATIGTNFVPADTGLRGAACVDKLHGVVVRGRSAGRNLHDVAAVIAGSASVAGVGNLSEGSALLVAVAEGLVAGAGVGRGAGGSHGGDRDGGRGDGGGRGCRRRNGGGRRRSRLLGHDELAANNGTVSVAVSVVARVSRGAHGGGQDNGGGELHRVVVW